MPENIKKLQPMTKHGYVDITPTVNFRVRGQDADSATAIRKMYREGNDQDRIQIITDLYGKADVDIKDMFDKKLGVNDAKEGIIYGKEHISAGDNPVSIMREDRIAKLKENIQFMRERLRALKERRDYIDEKRSRKK
jgi:hypothetical protein